MRREEDRKVPRLNGKRTWLRDRQKDGTSEMQLTSVPRAESRIWHLRSGPPLSKPQYLGPSEVKILGACRPTLVNLSS